VARGETQVTKVIGSVPHFVGSDKAGHLAAPGLGDIEPNLTQDLLWMVLLYLATD